MSRTIFCIALGLSIISAAPGRGLQAGEPPAKEPAAEQKAREIVLSALEAEVAGENERRQELLKEARAAAPDLPEANWHLGRVRMYGGWLPLGDATAVVMEDDNLVKYKELRERAALPNDLRELGRWCQKHGYLDRARLHFAQVLAHAAASADLKAETVKELDLEQVGGAWLTREEVAARKAEAKQLESALSKWGPRLKRLQTLIDGDDFKRRDSAIAEFHKLDDPALVLLLPLFLNEGGDRFQEEVVKRLSAFEEYEATTALVKYAVLSEFGFVRSAAAQALRKRPLHEYVPLLLGGLAAPIKTDYRVTWDNAGRVLYSQAFLREGPTGNMLLVSHNLAAPTPVIVQLPRNGPAPRARPANGAVNGIAARDTRRAALAEQLNRTETFAAVTQSRADAFNSNVSDANRRVFAALQESTNQQLPQDPTQWWNWWQGYNEYQWPRQTSVRMQASSQPYYFFQPVRPMSCFVAGTPVRTETGTVPVESIKPGDRVLAQDQDSGELAFKVVLTTTVRPPTKTVKITAGKEQIVTTLGHPFWVSGSGWKMAKELAPGDRLHTLEGSVEVEEVQPAEDAPAYNLVVDDFNTYFVGELALLVHDNNFRRPTRAIVPGLVRK